MTIIALDFEATCLPRHGRSFPIEVGIGDERGALRSWLIRPALDRDDWTWTQEAERLHGISWTDLETNGLAPAQVITELAPYTAGARVFADSHYDALWLDTLCSASGVAPPCRIEHVSTLFEEMGATYEQIQQALEALTPISFRRHRAAEDARFIVALIRQIRITVNGSDNQQTAFDWPGHVGTGPKSAVPYSAGLRQT